MPDASRRLDMNQLMTLPQVAEYLQIAQRTVYHWTQRGKLPGFKLGTVWRFKREDIDRWIEGQKLQTKKQSRHDQDEGGTNG